MEKKRLRLRAPFRIFISLIAIVVIVTCYYPVSSVIKLMNHNYSFFSSVEIYKKDLDDVLLKTEYSDVINECIADSEFDVKEIDSYIKLDYYDRKDFLVNVNKMLKLRYKIEVINLINETVSDDFIKIIVKEYIYDIDKYLEIDIFKEENYERYKAYFNGRYDKTVLYVNIGLDKEYYEDVKINDTFSNTMLINKYNGISKDFKVLDLVQISKDCSVDEENYLSKDAASAFEKMCLSARNEGYYIYANSTYRDYQMQTDTYNKYYELYGQSYVDRYVTKPGFSEHHTGLALDIKSGSSNIFKNSKEYDWMKNNCHKYGFIHRYQESKVDITGIASEPWHYRYVGVDAAKYIYENNISFEEYYALFLDK